MNTPRKFFALIALSAVAAVRLSAAFESFKIEVTSKPQLSPVMQMDGITEGTVMIAVDVSAEGQLTDFLVLGTTHPALVRPVVEALREWKFTPARLDGVPVAVQTDLTVNFSAQGVVVSRPPVIDLDQYVQRMFGYRFAWWRRSSRDLDKMPTPLSPIAPKYAVAAEKDGVRGMVRVHFFIDETGSVRMPAVEGEAHPYLSAMALAAMREWRFTPPMSHGKPVLVAARQDFTFSQ
jgi:TonB family protein